MIYTCTTNPSLDYYITFDSQVELGKNSRSINELYDAGGKGVNVSIVLNNFQIPSICLGFLGGFTKDYYLNFLKQYPFIQPLFTSIKDNTRINVKIMDNLYETGLNAKGPQISDDEFDRFKQRTERIYSNDYFVLCGNIEDEIEDRVVDLVHELANAGVKIVLDTERSVVNRCLDIPIFLCKLNESIISTKNENELINYFKELTTKNVNNVLYSNPKMPSYFADKQHIYKCEVSEESLVNTTGASDSMVAGYLYSVLRGADCLERFKYANAASVATSMSNDLTSKGILEKRFNNIEVLEIK